MAAVPELRPCPVCNLPIQSGRGAGKLAWHDCDWVITHTRRTGPVTVEETRQLVLARLQEEVVSAGNRELIDILNALRDYEEQSHGDKAEADDDLTSFREWAASGS